MSRYVILLFLAVSAIATNGQTNKSLSQGKSYSGYKLYRCIPNSIEQVNHLRALANHKTTRGLDFWTRPRGVNISVDIMAAPVLQRRLTLRLNLSGIRCDTMMTDVGKYVRRSHLPASPHEVNQLGGDLPATDRFYSQFQTYDKIEDKLAELANDSRVTLETIGQSYEKRNLYLVKVSTDSSANKPIVFFDAGHHAREWISHSTLLFLLEGLVNDAMPSIATQGGQAGANNETLSKFLNKYDFWFVPAVNPDGYVYTHTTDRMWRKTRSKNKSGSCDGVDPNRNYGFHWAKVTDTCSEIYSGVKPFSEPESAALAKTLDGEKGRIIMYISLHSYSQLLLLPYSYKQKEAENYKEQKMVADAGVSALAKLRGTQYQAGVTSIILYSSNGDSEDYAYGEAKIRFAYGMELPDTGDFGFLLPAKDIIPVGVETTQGVVAMVGAMPF